MYNSSFTEYFSRYFLNFSFSDCYVFNFELFMSVIGQYSSIISLLNISYLKLVRDCMSLKSCMYRNFDCLVNEFLSLNYLTMLCKFCFFIQ